MEFALFLAQALGRKHIDTYTYALLLNAKQKRYTIQIPLCKAQPMANDDAHQCFVIFFVMKNTKI